MLGELWEHLGVSGLLDRHLPEPGSGRGFRPSEVVRSISNILFNGGEHLSDIRSLDSDLALRKFCGVKKFPAANTLTTWLNRCERWVESENRGGLQNVTLQGLERVNRELLGGLARAMKKTGLILDIDATVIKTAKRTAKIAYNGIRGYQPQLAFLPELRAFVVSDFRIGNEPCSKAVVSYLEHCKANMPDGTHIRMVRGDAAYYQRAVMNWCKDNGSAFLIRAGKNNNVMQAMSSISDDDWVPYVDKDGVEHSDTQVGGTWASMEDVGWFRLAVLRRRRDDPQLEIFDARYEYFPVATSLDLPATEAIEMYNARGRMEDGIGQLKQDFGLSAMPCADVKANAVWVAIGILTFSIFALFKVLALGGDWVVKKAKAVRFHVLNVPGKLVRHARTITLKLGCSAEFLQFLDDCRRRCRGLTSEFG